MMKIRSIFAAAAAVLLSLSVAGPALAADGVRIQEVSITDDGQVAFLLSGVGLADGESLDASSVVVEVDGKPVTATAASAAGTQRTTYLAIDTSGSMAGEALLGAKTAGLQYLDTVPADVSVGLIAFADDAQVLVPATTDRAAVSSALATAGADGSTALFDAALLAVEQLGPEGSRSIVLLSDGEDEGSTATEQQALAALTESGVTLDAVAMAGGPGSEQLGRLAATSGGVKVQTSDPAQLAQVFQSAALSAVSQLAVTAPLPAGQGAGTVPLEARVAVGDQVLTDTSVLLIDDAAVRAAAADNSAAAGPVAVSQSSTTLLELDSFLWVMLLVLFAAFAAIAISAFRLATDRGLQPRRMRKRLAFYDQASQGHAQQSDSSSARALVARAAELADEALVKKNAKRTLETRLATAAIPMKPGEWVVMHAGIALTSALVFAVLGDFSPLLGLLGLALGAFVPYAVMDTRSRRRRKEFYTALPDVMQLLAGSIASGYSFSQAVDSVAAQYQGVVAVEFNRAVAEARLGVPIEDALDDVAMRMDSRDFEWVVMAVRINKQVGGNLAELLRTLSKTLRERERVRRHVLALTAEGRFSVWVVAVVPFFLGAVVYTMKPELGQIMLTTTVGQALLLVALVFVVLGVVLSRQLIKIEV